MQPTEADFVVQHTPRSDDAPPLGVIPGGPDWTRGFEPRSEYLQGRHLDAIRMSALGRAKGRLVASENSDEYAYQLDRTLMQLIDAALGAGADPHQLLHALL